MPIDVVFIAPGNSKGIYQNLSNDYAAIEPPTWALLLAESCRSVNFSVDIIDVNVERLTHQQVLDRIITLSPRFVVFVVYGQNVNAGTTGMSGATALSKYIKLNKPDYPIVYIGSHVQAIPVDTLENESSIDIICTNEGVYALRNLLKIKKINPISLEKVKGIGYRNIDGVRLTDPEIVVPQERMDIDLPGYAWDLLTYKEKPFDLYRSPMWHAEYDFNKRSPYAAIQTSLGCQFKCSFCMINIINRSDNNKIGVASDYSLMRFWSTDFVIKQFDKLLDMGVKTIRIIDEMFLLTPKYYLPICKKLAERNKNDSLRMWAYSRVDTIKSPEVLELVRSAGIKWLALGIESAEKSVRLEVSKGKFEDVNIQQVVEKVHEADIEVMANYMFGLTGDTQETMEKTYHLSESLCTSGWNAYAVMALPGSAIYKSALEKGYKLPKTYEDFSFHSYNTTPLPTDSLTPEEILKFRDESYTRYHTNSKFLDRIQERYGDTAATNIKNMAKVKLKRKILGD